MCLFRFLNFALFVFLFFFYALNKESPCSLFSAAFLTCGIYSFMSSFFAIASLLSINNHKVVDTIATDPIHPVYSTIVSSQYGIVLPLFSYRSASIYKTRAPWSDPKLGVGSGGFFWPADAIRPLIRPLNRGLIMGINMGLILSF